MIEFEKLQEDEFMKLLGRVDRAEGALHVFRAALLEGGAAAHDARIRYERAHNELANFITGAQVRQVLDRREGWL